MRSFTLRPVAITNTKEEKKNVERKSTNNVTIEKNNIRCVRVSFLLLKCRIKEQTIWQIELFNEKSIADKIPCQTNSGYYKYL